MPHSIVLFGKNRANMLWTFLKIRLRGAVKNKANSFAYVNKTFSDC